jgi:murein L,D-transpeptidase YcbB/YkuD
MVRWLILHALMLGAAAPQAAPAPAPAATALVVALRSAGTDPMLSRDWARWRPPVTALYVRHGNAPLWFSQRRLTMQGRWLLEQLLGAEKRGLIAEDYDGAWLASAILLAAASRTAFEDGRMAQLDLVLSVNAARLASDLRLGRVDPASVGHDLDITRDSFDVATAVDKLVSSADVRAELDSFEPRFTHYALMKTALAHYLGLARDPQLTRLPPPGRSVHAGEEYAGAPQLRRLLMTLGDLPESWDTAVQTNSALDASLAAALTHFQARHGLEADGVLGPATFRALTTPLAQRARQIMLSMERMRWLPSRLDSPPIIVNVPQFRLFAFRGTTDTARDILQMDVIVGADFAGRRTPVFAADMRYVVLNPYWDVPRAILVQELLPRIELDPEWATRNGYELVEAPGDEAIAVPATRESVRLLASGKLRLRQKPGPGNPLGRVKFMFPNRHNVYLHDTPGRALFSRARRAFSHGCIRVADPLGLLSHVLRGEAGWDEARVTAALQAGAPVRVNLSRPIRVYILYGTALVTEAGEVMFFEDLYGHDTRLAALLAARRTLHLAQ